MKIHHHIIPTLLLSSFSLTAMAEAEYGAYAPPVNNDYVTITGSLGYRISEDIKDADGQKTAVSSETSQTLALGWTYDRDSEGEILFSNSKHTLNTESNGNIDLNVQYLHFGGRVLFTNNTPFSSSIGIAVGGTYFNPSGYDAELEFSGSLSAGVRYQLSERFALRGDLRVYGTVLSSDSTWLCLNGNCLVNLDNDVYVQTDLMAGIEYKF